MAAVAKFQRRCCHQVPLQGPDRRCLRWTWVKGALDGKWIQLEQSSSGKISPFEVSYPFVVVLYTHPELNWSFAESSTLTGAEKQMILRAHVNLGHPGVKEFVRLLKAAGSRNDVIQYVSSKSSPAKDASKRRGSSHDFLPQHLAPTSSMWRRELICCLRMASVTPTSIRS